MPKNLFYTILFAIILASCIQKILQKEMIFVNTPEVIKSPIYTAYLDNINKDDAMTSKAILNGTKSNENIFIAAPEELIADDYDFRTLNTDLVVQGDIEGGQKTISVECVTPQTISIDKEKSIEEEEVNKDYKIVGKIIRGIVKSLNHKDNLKKKFRSIKGF